MTLCMERSLLPGINFAFGALLFSQSPVGNGILEIPLNGYGSVRNLVILFSCEDSYLGTIYYQIYKMPCD